jgi:hypothetical protein
MIYLLIVKSCQHGRRKNLAAGSWSGIINLPRENSTHMTRMPRILVVEDHEDTCLLLDALLKPLGYELTQSTSAVRFAFETASYRSYSIQPSPRTA